LNGTATQQARKQPEAELETCCSLGGIRCLAVSDPSVVLKFPETCSTICANHG